jgi:hypothetical protein
VLYRIHFVFTSDICPAIHVTGDKPFLINETGVPLSKNEGGLYLLSDERSSLAPNNLVWKREDGNRFIFNTGSSNGWRIAKYSSLATGDYSCKGKNILMSFTITLQVPTYIVYVLNICINTLSLGGSQSLPIKQEVWIGPECGSDGAVLVQCTNGKLLFT